MLQHRITLQRLPQIRSFVRRALSTSSNTDSGASPSPSESAAPKASPRTVLRIVRDIFAPGPIKPADAKGDEQKGSSLGRVLHLANAERGAIMFAVGSLGVTTSISLVFPKVVGHILDVAMEPNPSASPMLLVGGLLAMFTAQSALMAVRTGVLNISGERIAATLRKQLFGSIVSQDAAFFDSSRTGDIMNRLSADTVVVQKALTTNVSGGFRNAFMVIGATGMLFYISPQLSLISLGLIPVVAFGGRYFGRYMKDQQKIVQDHLGHTMDVAEELVGNMRTVRHFARERYELARFGQRVDEAFEQARRVGIASAAFEGSLHLAANVVLISVLGYGGSLVLDGAMTAGDLTSFILYSVYVGFNVGGLSNVYSELMRASGAASRIFSVIDSQAEIERLSAAEGTAAAEATQGFVFDPKNLEGRVEFENVTFAYPTRQDAPVLQGVNLTLNPGEVVGLVGGSGSGKSTIGHLLTRLYDPTEGCILVDGVDIRSGDPQSLRNCIGTVSQEPVLFARSIADNIRYGKLDASDAEVQAAAEQANAHGFITSFPAGYDTLVGERGMQLSGGQKQRIAIARAILKDPRILVLDESTSALDAESEQLVQDALNRVMDGRTVISIAHRLSTMRHAHKIAVLQDARVAEVGAFKDLVADGDSKFATLMRRQLIPSADSSAVLEGGQNGGLSKKQD